MASALLMRYLVVIPIAVCWAILARLGDSDLCAEVTSKLQVRPEMSQQREETSAKTEQGTASEPKRIQLPPAEEPPQLSPEVMQVVLSQRLTAPFAGRALDVY